MIRLAALPWVLGSLAGCGEPAGEVVTAAPEAAVPAPEPPRMTRPASTRVFEKAPQLPGGLSDPWMDVGACPAPADGGDGAKCCRYGEWTATADAPVLDAPGGAEIGRVAVGERVTTVTGQVAVHPRPARVGRETPMGGDLIVRPGEIVWVLGPGARGKHKLYARNQVVEAEAPFVTEPQCMGRTTDLCWAAMDPAPDAAPPTWWVQLKWKGAKAAWVDNTARVLTDPACTQ